MTKPIRHFVLLLFMLMIMTASTAFAASGETKTVGVLDLRNYTNQPSLGSVAADEITADLLKINTCTVVERRRLKEVLNEQALGQTGIIDANTAAQLGQVLGLDYVMIGGVSGETKVTPGHYEYNEKKKTKYWVDESKWSTINLSLSLIEVSTGHVVWSSRTTGETAESTEALSEAVYDAIRSIYNYIPLQGYVIKVQGTKFYIDLGREHNITVKDHFMVTHEGEEFVHPVTGQVIKEKRNIGLLEVVDVMDGMAIAIRIPDSDGKIRGAVMPGDRITRQLKDKPGKFLGIFGSNDHIY